MKTNQNDETTQRSSTVEILMIEINKAEIEYKDKELMQKKQRSKQMATSGKRSQIAEERRGDLTLPGIN